ncbi:uncharacterized protein LOC124143827 [Haliotis rufescens]|uniref:uncharacterized protein LOC124143827 n=1 Tax=Haliotis rufescens TaxID=6454 RepID=UPI00201F9C9F|nr:uncharacterized protein LOC124143827 [Haliotis rufescens]
MKYGASVNIRDASGKQPIDYVEPGTRIYDDLRNGANSYKREQMLRTRMDYMTKKADTDEQQRHYESSLKWFENAIALAEDITDVSQEVDILHRRCAGINFLLGKYDDAIRSAEASIALNASQYKGYIEKGLAQNKLHMSDATKTFSHAVLMITTCMKQSFGETREDLTRKMKFVDDLRCYMSRVIEELVRSSSWNIVKIIVMGEGYVQVKSRPHKNVKEFIQTISTNVHFTEFSAVSIDLAPIVMAPRSDPKSAWLDELALLLIVKGASLESMAPSSNDTTLHAAVRLCVKSGSSWVLKYLLENHEDMTEIRGIQDRSGRTLYHTICETCGAKDAETGLELTNLLLHYKFDHALEDKRNRTPTDIRTTPKPIYDLLKQKLTDPKCMEECARRQLQMFNYQAAIWTFTQTIDLVEAKSSAG